MSNSPLISNKRKTQVASDGMPHGSGWNACSLPPRKPLSRLGKKVLPKLHKRLLKRPGTPPPKQLTGRSPKRKATPPTRQPRNSREKRQPRREPLLLHPTAPGPQWCLRRRLIEAHETERTWIGRELHDDINQRLALLAIDLDRWNQNASTSDEVTELVGHTQARIIEIAQDVQALSHRLHSSKLDYLA